MKSLVELLSLLLADCGERCGAPVSRDVRTLRERIKHEGDSFATITLPAYCSDFERSLDMGRIGPGSFLSFRKVRSGIPAFLQGFLSKVFDSEGVLLPKPSVDCIRAIRQVCLFCKKVRRECSEERLVSATAGYVKCDGEVRALGKGQLDRYYRKVGSVIIESLLLADGDWTLSDLHPNHGPGQTQERITGNSKWRFRRWHRRLTRMGFTYSRFGRVSALGTVPCIHHNQFRDDDSCVLVRPRDEKPVRVVFVPKTLKTPRVIAVEPVCMQYAQQSLEGLLRRRIESGCYTRGHVNIRDQSINQKMALEGSREGKFASLDLSEASDRVSISHVSALLRSAPKFRRMAFACRSMRGELPSGEVIRLKKFASMGSALCFPMEALVFFTSIIASRILRAGEFPDRHTVMKHSRDVYVYGDDLIVPADEASVICDDLELLGFKVNRRKSFWNGKFRESCGVDAFEGRLVTPTYLRSDVPADRRDVPGILSAVATANQLYEAGYLRTSTAIRKAVERLVGRLPQVPVEGPAIGWTHYSEVRCPTRFNRHLQRAERLLHVVTVPRMPDPLEGDPALTKCLSMLNARVATEQWLGVDTKDTKHLVDVPRPYALALKRKWVGCS